MTALKIIESILQILSGFSESVIFVIFSPLILGLLYLVVKAVSTFFIQSKSDKKLDEATKAIGRCEVVIEQNIKILQEIVRV